MSDAADRIAKKLLAKDLLHGCNMPSFHLLGEALKGGNPETPRFSKAVQMVNKELVATVSNIIRIELSKGD